MDACSLNNDHFLKEMPPASSRAAVLGIETADITDLSPLLPHAPFKSCQEGQTKGHSGRCWQGTYCTAGLSGPVPSQTLPVPAGSEAL